MPKGKVIYETFASAADGVHEKHKELIISAMHVVNTMVLWSVSAVVDKALGLVIDDMQGYTEDAEKDLRKHINELGRRLASPPLPASRRCSQTHRREQQRQAQMGTTGYRQHKGRVLCRHRPTPRL